MNGEWMILEQHTAEAAQHLVGRFGKVIAYSEEMDYARIAMKDQDGTPCTVVCRTAWLGKR